MTGIIILAIIAIGIVGYIILINTNPQFGAQPTKSQKEYYSKAPNYINGKFINPVETSMSLSFREMMSVMYQHIKGGENRTPPNPLPVVALDSIDIAESDNGTRLTWFGHSAILLEIDNKNILLDPMFGQVAAPISFLGPKRFTEELPIVIDRLPQIDAVLYSHDHYDHLDYWSVQKLKDKVEEWYVPLGVAAHLESWGVPKENIHESNWWEKVEFKKLTFISTPARHFSGRRLTNRFSTLWAGWIIKSEKYNIFFSGDSGYGAHFREIGEKYGPFDFAMIECGQYNERWKEVHMMPEETAQVALDLKAKVTMPIHWGAFRMALHSWTDPVERVIKKAEELGVSVTTPKIGETIEIGEEEYPRENWWEEI